MIPYIHGKLTEIAGLPIHMFGILVALGVILGDRLVQREGVRLGLDERDVRFVNVRIVIGGFVMAHIVSVVFYFPERLKENPFLVLINVWSGLSSYGGFLGAALTFAWLMRREKLPWRTFADAIALGLAPAWILGRLGCYTAHDHPGLKTDFFLAVRYPEGPRHDLGFYEMLLTIPLTIALYAVSRRTQRRGMVIGLFAVLYAPIRFALDFLRATDVDRPDLRYGGLTPAQWACFAAIGVGVWIMHTAREETVAPADSGGGSVDDATGPGGGGSADQATGSGGGSVASDGDATGSAPAGAAG